MIESHQRHRVTIIPFRKDRILTKPMRWAFQIKYTTLDRRNLVDLLAGIGFHPADIPGYDNAFRSVAFEGFERAEQVWEEAVRIRELVATVTEIDTAFALGPVLEVSVEEPIRHLFFESRTEIVSKTSTNTRLTVSQPEHLSEDERIAYENHRAERAYRNKLEAQLSRLEPAFREPRAGKLLELLKRRSHTGESLYKIYELAEGHPSRRRAFLAQFDISETDFKRFSDAVHNPVVSGAFARHAYEGRPRTENPMTIGEATAFVMAIARRWLASLRR